MKRYGYARVSTDGQTLDVQRDALKAAGCDVILEETASGASREGRPKLALLLDVIGKDDQLIVTKLDRLARNTVDMLEIVAEIGDKGAGLRSLAESWADTTSSGGVLILTVFAGFAQWERSRIRERQAEGIEAAKRKGIYKGKPRAYDREVIRALAAAGKRPREIRAELGCSFDTITRALR